MAKLIKVYADSQLVECPEKWEAHKGIVSECTVYESSDKAGKFWFYLIGDLGDSYTYFHCSPGSMEHDEENHLLTFDTGSGSHYVVSIGEEKPEDYQPAYVVGHGEAAMVVDPKAHVVAYQEPELKPSGKVEVVPEPGTDQAEDAE